MHCTVTSKFYNFTMTLLHYLGHSRRRWCCHCECLSDGASAIKDIHLKAKEYASEEEMENQQQLFDVRPLSLPFFILFCYLGAPPLNCCIVLALLLWQFHAGHVASTHSHPATKKKRCRERKRKERNGSSECAFHAVFALWAQDVGWSVLFNGSLCCFTKDVGRTQ